MNCYNCNTTCNKLCPHYIISTSLSVVTVNGVDTLLINIPSGTYCNKQSYCIIIAQNRPSTATVDMPVSISIGGDTSTVYPLVCNRTCLQANACQISGRSRIKVVVQTNISSGVFRACSGLGSCCSEMLASLPAPTTGATPAVASLETAGFTVRTTSTKPKKGDTATEVK